MKKEKEYVDLNEDIITSLKAVNKSPEGIWLSYRNNIGIIKEKDNTYKAFSLATKELLFTLKPISGNEFELKSFTGYSGKASLRLNDKVLELYGDDKFVRKTGDDTKDNALLRSYISEYPNGVNTYPVALALTDSTLYLRIPDFSYDITDQLVKKHWNDIISRPNLIVDIRNNSGGQDNFFEILSKLIYSKPYYSKGVEWYATPNNIKMYEEAMEKGEIRNGEEGMRRTRSLVNEMKKNIGGFVIHPMMGKDQWVKFDTVYKNPKRVGIIINEENASSAEQFILNAKQSSKTITFGNANTAGVLDYSNAISEKLPSGNYSLTFPMTRSRRLPDNPIDNVGITPDVIVPYPSTIQLFDRLDQWVYYVKDYLELMK